MWSEQAEDFFVAPCRIAGATNVLGLARWRESLETDRAAVCERD
jgi:hypothetical protein